MPREVREECYVIDGMVSAMERLRRLQKLPGMSKRLIQKYENEARELSRNLRVFCTPTKEGAQ